VTVRPRIADRALVSFLRATAAVGGALAVMGSAAIVADGHARALWSDLIMIFVLFAVFFFVVAWLVIPRQPHNAVVWTITASAFFSGLFVAGLAAASLVADDPMLVLGGAESASPAELGRSASWILMFTGPAVLLANLPLLTFGFLLFPDGRLPSRRWRWVAWLAGVGLVAATLGFALGYQPGSTAPAGEQVLLDNAFLIIFLAIILSLAALILRFRRSRGTTRQQFKWVVWGASIFGPVMIVAIALGGTSYEDLVPVPFIVATIVFLLSYAIAVGKYRLYDVDVVISKTVAYVLLGIAIAAIYGAAAFGLILLFGDPDQGGGNAGLVLPATALVAILFEPLRVRLERLANRVVYGKRAAPHEVLSGVTSRLADASAGEGLAALARLLREGTGAESAAVWLRVGDRLRVEATSPADARPNVSVLNSEKDLPRSDLELSVPVLHGGELLGALGVTKHRSHPVSPADEDLLGDVAAGTGLLLRNMRLNAELANRAAQLQTSRRRLIAAHDAARHRLERDLHDGAQQQVVALKVRLGLAQSIAEREGARDVAARVADLADGTQQAVDAMRMVARGIYPPLLEAEGLGLALTAARRTSTVPVRIEAEGLPRYAKEVEGTVYFCVLAAMKRAEMAGADSAQVKVHGNDSSLTATIAYDATDRSDLSAIIDRIDAFGGKVTEAASAEGTKLTLALPVVGEVMAPA